MLDIRLALQIELAIEAPHAGVHDERRRVFLAKKKGESLEHVLMKLLGYVLFFHPDLEIEASADQHYKPDLLRVDDAGNPVQWVDCGSTGLRKLERISARNRRTTIDIVKPTRRELELYKRQADLKVSHPERVRYFAFDDGFLAALTERVQSRHTVEAHVIGELDRLRLVVDGDELETAIHRGNAPEGSQQGGEHTPPRRRRR